MKKIYLVGFMGSGKTTLANYLSKQWEIDFVDLDHIILDKEKQSISSIFKQRGEAYFRKVETAVLLETQSYQNTIIATGGGVVENAVNRNFLNTQDVIYLKWPFEILYHRIKKDKQRPLAGSYEVLKARFDLRNTLYEEVATIVIDCEGETLESVSKILSVQYNK